LPIVPTVMTSWLPPLPSMMPAALLLMLSELLPSRPAPKIVLLTFTSRSPVAAPSTMLLLVSFISSEPPPVSVTAGLAMMISEA
jgi:hypothetical protein